MHRYLRTRSTNHSTSDRKRGVSQSRTTSPTQGTRASSTAVQKTKDAEDRRHKVAHGVWTWAEGNPTRLLAYSFRPDVAFQHGFDLDKLRKLGDEIGAIGFQIEYPGGEDEYWRVSFELVC